jgi:hypothetical protein
MRILFVSVIFATLLAVIVVTGNQQAACHAPVCDIFCCNDNRLEEDTGAEAGTVVAAEVHFFCTFRVAARREEPIFQAILSLERG